VALCARRKKPASVALRPRFQGFLADAPLQRRPRPLSSRESVGEARMLRRALLSVMALLLLGAAARAQIYIYHANDTGGIIPWSCENEAIAQQVAAAYCARWDKYHRITSVHRQFGDFIAFSCLWTQYINPYALPAVPTRNTCYYPRPLPVIITK
jgi:hypothetical protein